MISIPAALIRPRTDEPPGPLLPRSSTRPPEFIRPSRKYRSLHYALNHTRDQRVGPHQIRLQRRSTLNSQATHRRPRAAVAFRNLAVLAHNHLAEVQPLRVVRSCALFPLSSLSTVAAGGSASCARRSLRSAVTTRVMLPTDNSSTPTTQVRSLRHSPLRAFQTRRTTAPAPALAESSRPSSRESTFNLIRAPTNPLKVISTLPVDLIATLTNAARSKCIATTASRCAKSQTASVDRPFIPSSPHETFPTSRPQSADRPQSMSSPRATPPSFPLITIYYMVTYQYISMLANKALLVAGRDKRDASLGRWRKTPTVGGHGCVEGTLRCEIVAHAFQLCWRSVDLSAEMADEG